MRDAGRDLTGRRETHLRIRLIIFVALKIVVVTVRMDERGVSGGVRLVPAYVESDVCVGDPALSLSALASFPIQHCHTLLQPHGYNYSYCHL
ncbi:hypothetical protein O3P69_020139 [Scylla paramamosain]|uniref:Secreted protein n=1 Tax=Scylla paramamosain TaxID=85552 RepID=A0AAW0TLU9_SCYPA